MYLKIADNGEVTLEEATDFGRFHISAAPRQVSGAAASTAFLELSEDAGEGHYWLDADALVALSPEAGKADWTASFWSMLQKAEPYGFADVAGRRVKAHLIEP